MCLENGILDDRNVAGFGESKAGVAGEVAGESAGYYRGDWSCG